MPQDQNPMMPPEAPMAPAMDMEKMSQMLEELASQYPELEKEAMDLGDKLSALQDEEEPSLEDEEAPMPEAMDEEEPSLP